MSDLVVGQRVNALFGDGVWYPAKIVAIDEGGTTACVQWDDGGEPSILSVEHLKRRRGRPHKVTQSTQPDFEQGERVEAFSPEYDQWFTAWVLSVDNGLAIATIEYDGEYQGEEAELPFDRLRKIARPDGDYTGQPEVINMPVRDKSEAFRRLAENRTNEALEVLRKIKNLSNRGNYEYTPDQAQRIITTIRMALDETEQSFHIPASVSYKRFKL